MYLIHQRYSLKLAVGRFMIALPKGAARGRNLGLILSCVCVEPWPQVDRPVAPGAGVGVGARISKGRAT